MENIGVKYNEIDISSLNNQVWNLPLQLTQEERFSLKSYAGSDLYSLNLFLKLSFSNLTTNTTSQIYVTVPIEFESKIAFEGRDLYPSYLAGYEAARNLISFRFINSNIGIQPEQFHITSLPVIESKLIDAVNEKERV